MKQDKEQWEERMLPTITALINTHCEHSNKAISSYICENFIPKKELEKILDSINIETVNNTRDKDAIDVANILKDKIIDKIKQIIKKYE